MTAGVFITIRYYEYPRIVKDDVPGIHRRGLLKHSGHHQSPAQKAWLRLDDDCGNHAGSQDPPVSARHGSDRRHISPKAYLVAAAQDRGPKSIRIVEQPALLRQPKEIWTVVGARHQDFPAPSRSVVDKSYALIRSICGS